MIKIFVEKFSTEMSTVKNLPWFTDYNWAIHAISKLSFENIAEKSDLLDFVKIKWIGVISDNFC